eukprot:COSAG02_NODE_13461_length_1392_cov_1.499613_2_plen_32_part_01
MNIAIVVLLVAAGTSCHEDPHPEGVFRMVPFS